MSSCRYCDAVGGILLGRGVKGGAVEAADEGRFLFDEGLVPFTGRPPTCGPCITPRSKEE